MKKILMALAIVSFTCFSAEAQTVNISCGRPDNKVCKRTGNGISCYKTKYAENFKVCKGALGYYVCCETPNATNSTFPALPLANNEQNNVPSTTYYAMEDNGNNAEATTDADQQADLLTPQSQSYPAYSANSATSYEGYYPVHHIKVCENTNNVAKANRAPYKGCPAPAYDGPDKNKQRNVNFTSPNSSFPQPPVSGNRQ